MVGINIWAVLVSAAAHFALGALWFSPWLFAKPWMQEIGLTPEKIKATPASRMRVLYGTSLATALVMAVALAYLIRATNMTGLAQGLQTGLIVGIGLVAASNAPPYGFGGKSLRLYLIDQGYAVVGLAMMGAILAVWQ